jgi:uncharacterized protein DUF6789
MRILSREDQPTATLLSRAVIAGFVATGLMSLALVAASFLAEALGSESGGIVSRWLWGLTHNPVVSMSMGLPYVAVGVHFAVGLAFALAYASYLEPKLSGPGWWRGARFALIPWLLSILVVFPVLGGGFLGLELGAGPLPILGNLILHLVYGASVGWTYGVGTSWQEEAGRPAGRVGDAQENSLAIGVVVGALAGGLLGWAAGAVFGPSLAGLTMSTAALVLVGALCGSSSGAIVGPLLGMVPRK